MPMGKGMPSLPINMIVGRWEEEKCYTDEDH
jgi:hypothetical protein